jgi:ABC-type multidrug transport system fused ATPase/permease subunit
MQLLLKNYAAQEGRVMIGGREISEVDAGWLREKVGYVGQEPTLFNGSIRENILVGRADASEAEVWAVLREVPLFLFRSTCTTSWRGRRRN